MNNFIEIKGARVNNLKNVSLKIPRDKLIVITGVSGSGKSSLAFDTLYAEGQRRYVESLSSYARQFLGRMSKPECDFIKGLPPAIAIEQKTIARNPRSTVGTSTEIYEYLRLLFARIGKTYSPISGQEVKKHTPEDIIQRVLSFSQGTKFLLMAPVLPPQGRTLHRQLEMLLQQGYTRIFTQGTLTRIEDILSAPTPHTPDDQPTSASVYLLIDRMSVDQSKSALSRLTDSIETALYEGHGQCRLMFLPSNMAFDFSTRFEADGITFQQPSDNLFSFNSPLGACPQCEGFGSVIGIDEKLVIPNSTLSVYDGCVQCWHGDKMRVWQTEFCRRAQLHDFPIFTPYMQLTSQQKDWLWHGLPSERHKDIHDQVSIDSFFHMVKENQYKIQYRVMMSRYRGKTTCPDCQGTRLRKEASYVKINGKCLPELVQMPIQALSKWFLQISLSQHDHEVAKRLLAEINNRLQFLLDVGLPYLTLNRPSNTLSGGESQRINLTTSLGSSLVGSLYILDEPSIGLHPRDTHRLIHVLRQLQAIGNTVIVVEHDEDIMRAADHIIDVGPDAGTAGGEIVFQGTPEQTLLADNQSSSQRSHTVQYLNHHEPIPTPATRRPWNLSILLRGARMNNLCAVDARFPLNVLTVITGVSGSGKSSLIKGTLYPALKRHFDEVCDSPGEHLALEGDIDHIKHVEMVDQNPIGKSTRSNPATYLKAYDLIRQLFSEMPLAKQLSLTPQHFSFNTEGGRCEECKGAGNITVEMQFMADLHLECPACHGQRFKSDILDVRFKDKNIHEVLNMTVSQAIDFFTPKSSDPNATLLSNIVARLQPLAHVGLHYITLGQSSSTLSGGENQRVKLAYHIAQEKQEPTLFIFDEPTTGLHPHDIHRLLQAFQSLIVRGHSLIVIEHNLEIIKSADHIIDLGPEGGPQGGRIIAQGTPEQVAQSPKSLTGKFIQEKLRQTASTLS